MAAFNCQNALKITYPTNSLRLIEKRSHLSRQTLAAFDNRGNSSNASEPVISLLKSFPKALTKLAGIFISFHLLALPPHPREAKIKDDLSMALKPVARIYWVIKGTVKKSGGRPVLSLPRRPLMAGAFTQNRFRIRGRNG